ncbi:trafficking protein particle complex subunit 5 isoform X1 [Grammomys surdaster]|uniref:trafficking protein particle complex subunit 5 isoform X1 n=1 Tax=Grammomys surdaster TaxID=491861 RepID=UPI00109F4763|nr:trafficking protein particle complex subunit 5 isoform X1 [Grammomys surdaster]
MPILRMGLPSLEIQRRVFMVILTLGSEDEPSYGVPLWFRQSWNSPGPGTFCHLTASASGVLGLQDCVMEARFTRGKSALLERALVRPRTEVSLSAFALLFSELVQHCQSRVFSVAELQARLAALGRQVGARVLDALVAREKGARRETKVLGALLFVKGAVWKALFGKEADKLEQANDDARTFYIIEREPLINTYISVPKENSTLNCASFTAGIVEAVLTHSGFPAKVTAHWHKGTTLMIKFEEAVIARDRALEGR